MVLMFWLRVGYVVKGGVVCHVFVLRLCVPREPWDRRLLVDSMVFPAEPPPGAQGGDAISVTGGCAAQNREFQALKMSCLCGERVLCT